jgi:hypothetical protein
MSPLRQEEMTAALRTNGHRNGSWHGQMEDLLSDFVPEPKKVVNTLTNNREFRHQSLTYMVN